MPRAYSDDLRCKLLEAYEAGRGSLQELAKQFGVSWGYSKKIRARQVQTGSSPAVAERAEGAAGAEPAWSCQSVDGWGGAAVTVDAPATARSDLGGIATT
ncbi:MAG: hypothetical protein WCC92_08885, partial [Candidatus Korobacteraceae bacterium]